MLVNGKEVEVKPQQTANIQKNINSITQLPDTLKSQITPEEMKDILPPEGVDSANVGFFAGQEEEGTRTRKERYDTFREMDGMVFIHRALETVSDDGAQRNDEGNVIKLYSDSEEIQQDLEDLFYNRININKELWTIIYQTVKMGDNFYEVIPDSYERPKKIVKIRYLEPDKVERIEVNNKLAYFTYKDEVKDSHNKKVAEKFYRLQPWQIIHFKIDNKEFEPYGGSLLNAGIRTYRRLSLLEDVMLVYRLSRSPERRVFYVDVGQLSPIEAKRFLQKFRDNYRTQQFIDETGKINRRANVLSVTSDIFIPVREGGQGTKIDTLQSGQALNSIDDLKYFKDEILRTMNIPPDYLGDNVDRSRGSLAMLDQKFARFIERVQGHVEDGLVKICALELFFAGFKKDDLQNFKVEMTPPSNVKEITDIEFVNQRMNLLQTMINLNIFPTRWILKKVMRLSDKEINDVLLYKELEDQKKAGQAGAAEAGMGGMAGGMADMGGMDMAGATPDMGGAVPAPEMGATPETTPDMGAAAAAAAPAPEQQLTASVVIDLLGQDFLLENQEDFFKIVKAIDNNKNKPKMLTEEQKEDTSTLLEAFSHIMGSDKSYMKDLKESKMSKKSGKVSSMFINNEFGGLMFGEERGFKVWRNVENKMIGEFDPTNDRFFREEKIDTNYRVLNEDEE